MTAWVHPNLFSFWDACLTLCVKAPLSARVKLDEEMRVDLHRCLTFWPHFGFSSTIKIGPWLEDPGFFSAHVCPSGVGIFFNCSYFPKPEIARSDRPARILTMETFFKGNQYHRKMRQSQQHSRTPDCYGRFKVVWTGCYWPSFRSSLRQNSVLALNSGRSRIHQ